MAEDSGSRLISAVAFGFLSVRPFPVRGWRTKKAWQDFIPLLEHLGRPSGFPKTTLLLIYPLTVFSLAVAHSHDWPILIEAVGSEICLNSSAALRRGCNILGINRDFSKGSIHTWAGGIRKCVWVCVCALSYIQTGSLVTTSITKSFTNDSLLASVNMTVCAMCLPHRFGQSPAALQPQKPNIDQIDECSSYYIL